MSDAHIGKDSDNNSLREASNPLDNLSDNELIHTVREIQADAKRKELENQIFENFLMANEPSLIASMAQTLEAAKKLHFPGVIQPQVPMTPGITMAPVPSTTSASPSRNSGVHSEYTGTDDATPRLSSQSNTERGPRINVSLKTDLVMREFEAMQYSLKRFIGISHRKKCTLKAEIEESNIRAHEMQQCRSNFEQTIVIEAVEKLTQKIPAEKFVRYMQEWLKNAQFMLEKLRLRTSSLRSQQNKLRNLLTQKEELGESIHEVDFEKLNIENKNFQIKIEQKNKHLLEIKQINGKASLMLSNHKKILQKQDESLKNLRKNMKCAQKRIVELTDECVFTKDEVADEKERYRRLKKYVDMYEVPDVLEYVKKKAELNDLCKTLKTWRRKRNIQKVAMSTYTKMMMHMTGELKPRSSWYHINESSTFGSITNISVDSITEF